MKAARVAPLALVPTAFVACGLTVVGQEAPSETSTDAGREAASAIVDSASTTPDGNGDVTEADTGATADAEPPDADEPLDAAAEAGPTTSVGATSLDPSNLTIDCARPADGPISGDGVSDGVFDVELTGPATAMALLLTDVKGSPFGAQQWDTWVGDDTIPSGVASGYVYGVNTYQLGVEESGTLLNDANGRLTLPAGTHVLRICATNVGSFAVGSHFRVVVEDPQGDLVYGPVVTY